MCNTFDTTTGQPRYDRILQFLSEVDAYYIGFINYSAEVARWSLGASDFVR